MYQAVHLVNKLEEETNFNRRKMANKMDSCMNQGPRFNSSSMIVTDTFTN